MNAKTNKSKAGNYILISALLLFISSGLAGCDHQPKSLFEQKAEAESANEIETRAHTSEQMVIVAPVTPATTDNAAVTPIHIIKKQTIAQQRNCDPTQNECQYFELNVLEFNPEQPWLNGIMWQTIARVLAPETSLASQDDTAKKTVLMLFDQVEYSEQVVDTLPIYQHINTELVLNPTINSLQADERTRARKNERGYADTGYLEVQSSQQRGVKRQPRLSYVMLDMQKKLQLTMKDVLLPQVTTDELSLLFQTAKKDYLSSHSDELQSSGSQDVKLQDTEPRSVKGGALSLSQQWYLDDKGLHMVYQAGELLDMKTESVDLMVPYELLQGLIKPRYIVQTLAERDRK
ncbi:hypothetical protein [Psychrobacter frigidicola]|uniref:hypothetical protein n=1 Tax=Psychrobacter frigidicola TaxID=45611 RepID=UPI001919C285|nr:hypothetical protein [Psychrobacter frigidicola]